MMRPFTFLSARTAVSRACSCSKVATAGSSNPFLLAKRNLSSLPTLRPTILPRSTIAFRTSTLSSPPQTYNPNALGAADSAALDLVPKSAITSNPSFSGVQIRCGPRPTMARTSRLVRKRRHGFLSRIRTRTGRRVLQRRKTKGRHVLSM